MGIFPPLDVGIAHLNELNTNCLYFCWR